MKGGQLKINNQTNDKFTSFESENRNENENKKSVRLQVKSISKIGICTALALILSYIEFILPPIFVPIPMIKIGLSNIILLFSIYKLSPRQTIIIAFMKVTLSAILFGSFVSFAYSSGGAILSIISMFLLKKFNRFSYIGVSVIGAVMHNIGQIIVAYFIISSAVVLTYLPTLIFIGTLSGIMVGILASILIKNVK